jgi:hypothetical protein
MQQQGLFGKRLLGLQAQHAAFLRARDDLLEPVDLVVCGRLARIAFEHQAALKFLVLDLLFLDVIADFHIAEAIAQVLEGFEQPAGVLRGDDAVLLGELDLVDLARIEIGLPEHFRRQLAVGSGREALRQVGLALLQLLDLARQGVLEVLDLRQ